MRRPSARPEHSALNTVGPCKARMMWSTHGRPASCRTKKTESKLNGIEKELRVIVTPLSAVFGMIRFHDLKREGGFSVRLIRSSA